MSCASTAPRSGAIRSSSAATATGAQVIEIYRVWLWREIRAGRIGLDELAALDGKRLACWCAPEPCHGDVLAEAARWATERLRSTGD